MNLSFSMGDGFENKDTRAEDRYNGNQNDKDHRKHADQILELVDL